MSKKRMYFTSESVTEGHPDKMADQISDSILDAIIAQDPNGRVACETLVTTGQVHVVGEISTSCYVDIPRIIRDTVQEIGGWEVKRRDSAVLAALSNGVSIRQLSRITGISKTVIERIGKK